MFYPFSLSIESQGPKASPSLTSAVAVVMLGTFSAPRLAPAAAAVLCCAAAQIINFTSRAIENINPLEFVNVTMEILASQHTIFYMFFNRKCSR